MAESAPSFDEILYEKPADHVVRITLNRPEARNAQGLKMTYELNAAFNAASHDDDVKVVILAGADPHFSAGHDLADRGRLKDFAPIGTWGQFRAPGHEGFYAREIALHQLCHSHNMRVHGMPIDPQGLPGKLRASLTAAATAANQKS